MAQQETNSQQAQPQEPAKPRKPWFGTPTAILILGLLVWVLALAAAGGATVANHMLLQDATFTDEPTRIAFNYLVYFPSTLLAVLGVGIVVLAAVRWGVYGRDAVGVPDHRGQQEVVDLLKQVNQRLLISEAAKRIAYREQDLQALRHTIQMDVERGQFDAALVLVGELAQTYGYREEAETFREQIAVARSAEQDAKISESLARLDEILARHDFDRAGREAAKIQRLYPESERVRDVTRRVREARERYKMQLEREFLEAAEREDITQAMNVLKTMDKYLSEAEAAPLRETARGVIGKQRDNLGVQFKIAVQDKEWTAAVRVGEQIIREFPNTRMAEEVRAMIDLLRERAAGQQAVQATP
ncbi:hypothetical protein ACERK3_16765 [Phycisphaerales bacterium AB-hyl4]|uniref:Tetratricopeptide repeat protein n=1 Tax=Natronomicrosphaera hydrolytica TaxID=3242702 RepID=A0ABV4U8L0_9BACT